MADNSPPKDSTDTKLQQMELENAKNDPTAKFLSGIMEQMKINAEAVYVGQETESGKKNIYAKFSSEDLAKLEEALVNVSFKVRASRGDNLSKYAAGHGEHAGSHFLVIPLNGIFSADAIKNLEILQNEKQSSPNTPAKDALVLQERLMGLVPLSTNGSSAAPIKQR